VRAEFNTTCEIFTGPSAVPPNTPVAFDVPCRLVPDPLFKDTAPPLSNALSYLTLEAFNPSGPSITDLGDGVYLYDYDKANRLIIASLPDVTWRVLRVELCTGSPTAYYRASIDQVEDDGPTGCPATYSEAYVLADSNDGIDHLVTRTGDTTWEGEGYTMEAEVEWVNEELCLSKWVIHKDDAEWINIGWDGVADGIFYDYVGPLLPILVNPS